MAKPTGANVRLFDYTIPAQSEAMTGFPLILPAPGASSDFWSLVASNGSDIHVYDAAWNELPYEAAMFDKSAKTINLWTKADLSSTVSTVIHYGCTGVAASNTPSGVWSAYNAIYHLGNGNDSSPNSYNLTVSNGSFAAGKLGNALSVGASTTALNADAGNVEYNEGFSCQCWFKRPGSTGNPNSLFGRFTESTYRGWWVYLTTTNTIAFLVGNSVSPAYIARVETAATYTDTNWHHLSVVKSAGTTGSTMKIYIDGVDTNAAVTNDTLGSRTIVGTQQFGVGCVSTGSYKSANHLIDQVQVIKTVRTQPWIAAQYANQNNPSTWGTLSSEYTSVAPRRQGSGLVVGVGSLTV